MLIFLRSAYHHRNTYDVIGSFPLTIIIIIQTTTISQTRDMASIGKGLILLILLLLWLAYVITGMFVFRAVEGNEEREGEIENQEQKERWNMSELRAATMQRHNMTQQSLTHSSGRFEKRLKLTMIITMNDNGVTESRSGLSLFCSRP